MVHTPIPSRGAGWPAVRRPPFRTSVRQVSRRPRRPAERPVAASSDGGGVTGRFSYGVDSTTVVLVDSPALPRIWASNASSAAGEATRTLTMYDSTPATEWQASISDMPASRCG